MRGCKLTLLTIVMLLLTAGASATQSQPIIFESQVDITTPLPFSGTWAASGLINDSGTLSEPKVFLIGGEIHITRICTGAKGTITIKIQSKVTSATDDTTTFVGEWVIVSGTGAYATLHDHGARAAIRIGGTVTETLTGEAHFD